MPNVTGDTGVGCTPAPRAQVFSTGVPAVPADEYSVDTATAAGADTFNPCPGCTNPPSAAPDPGGD